MRTLFLDTETTGLDGRRDRIVEVAIIGEEGEVIINTLVNPGIPIPAEASRIHGISDAMVKAAPNFDALWPKIAAHVRGNRIVIYNAKFDLKFFPDGLTCAEEIHCAMLAYAEHRGERTPKLRRFRWHKLSDAAAHVSHEWSGPAHRALGDAEACRSVWLWINESTNTRSRSRRSAQPRGPQVIPKSQMAAPHPDSVPTGAVPAPSQNPRGQGLIWFCIIVGIAIAYFVFH